MHVQWELTQSQYHTACCQCVAEFGAYPRSGGRTLYAEESNGHTRAHKRREGVRACNFDQFGNTQNLPRVLKIEC